MGLTNSRTIADVIQNLDQRAPSGTAEDWDSVGLLIGDASQRTSGAVLAIDLSFEAVELAIQKNYSLIINHHPCIFPKNRGLSKVLAGSPVYEAIRNGISVAAYHTNFDQCSLEVVETVSRGLGVVPRGRLLEKSSSFLMKLVTFVPPDFLEKVREAICKAGAGHIGNYDFCTFASEGEGSFRGGSSTQPFIGKPGELEKTREIRLETIFPKGLQQQILEALFKTHPYEEVAYDLYPVNQAREKAEGLIRGCGYGFWGEFPVPRPFSEVVKDVKSLFDINGFWITNPVPSSIARVGFVAGKGASFVDTAASLKCDLFITGEAGYHTALSGSRNGVTIMELGHRESEKFFIETMKSWLSQLNLEFAEVQTPTQKIWQEV